MKIHHICTKKDYEKDGEKKVKWYRVGFLKEADSGKKYIKFFHQPETEFFVFEKEDSQPEITEAAA
jgi:hypothetical protein